MSVRWLLDVASGKQKGLPAEFVRGGLWCLTPVYRWVTNRRNRQFDSGARPIKSVAAKVVSIGNLTTGGTGKTPMVVWMCELLQSRGIEVAIVSRGYGAKTTGQQNDEALELHARLPRVPHIQNPDRVAAANRCVEEHRVKAIVVDDGFQHRRLARDLDVVMIDASNPFGYGYLLPRGLLREPKSSLRRADVVVITRCDRVSADQLEALKQQIVELTSAPVLTTRTKPVSLIQSSGNELSIDEVRQEKWFVFSAIGNPAAFEKSLNSLGFNVCGVAQFRDHHHYSKSDLQQIVKSANDAGAERLLCTHKDLVKVATDSLGGLPIHALKIATEILEGEDVLKRRVLELFATLEALE